MDSEALNLTIDELVIDLQKHNGSLTILEIEIAFKNGWKRVYGDFFGLSNATYFGWVNAYAWSEKRFNAKKAIENAKDLDNVKPAISESEKEAIIRNGVISCYGHFKKSGIIYDSGNVTYNFLDKKGLIFFTKDVKISILEKCRTRLIENEKMNLAGGKVNQIRLSIERLQGDKSEVLIAESKREALKIYFTNLLEMDEDIQTII